MVANMLLFIRFFQNMLNDKEKESLKFFKIGSGSPFLYIQKT